MSIFSGAAKGLTKGLGVLKYANKIGKIAQILQIVSNHGSAMYEEINEVLGVKTTKDVQSK